MRISHQLMNSFSSLKDRINETSKTINRGGLEKTTENLFHKMRNDTFQATKDIELSGLNAVLEKYKHYGDIFDELALQIEEMTAKVIDSLDDGLNDESRKAIVEEMKEKNKFINDLTNTKIGDTKLFDIKTEMIIGDGLRATRTFDRDFIKIDGKEISEYLNEVIEKVEDGTIDTTDLDSMEKLHNFIQERNTIIGARTAGYERLTKVYESQQFSENEFMAKRYKMEEAIQELNDLSLNYEALSKTIAKISSLSLVNYV